MCHVVGLKLKCWLFFFFSSRRRHTRCALVTGVQTCALPIYSPSGGCRRTFVPKACRPRRIHQIAARNAIGKTIAQPDRQKKRAPFPVPSSITGGVDGTRTRDLRRDRPAF